METIATVGKGTGLRAGVAIVVITIVTVLPGVDDAVSAFFSPADCRAPVSGVLIAVIALFEAFYVFCEIQAENPVTTSGRRTGVETSIVVPAVAIVTVLLRVEAAIPAFLSKTIRRTTVACHVVAIITLFIAFSPPLQPSALDAVAATGEAAAIGAAVVVDLISIVAVLEAFRILVIEVEPGDSIATLRRGTVVQAGVCGVLIAIVAEFTGP